ncbi:MAG: hypothetical protein AAF721_41335 [Myxococcota bacterium]
MAIVGVIVGVTVAIIAVLQGAAWLGPRRRRRRGLAGALLLALGLLALQVSLLWPLVPGFWG